MEYELVRRYTMSSPESNSDIDEPFVGATVVSNTPEINPEREVRHTSELLSASFPESNSDINDASWIGSVRKQLNSASPKPPYRRRQWTIYRVPEHIRRGDPKAYEPLVVWIGPYHHHNAPRGSSTIHDYKWRCVRYLLSRHGSQEQASKFLDQCLSKLRALDAEVRSCYSDEVHHDDRELALMMLLDGCFIIYLSLLKPAKKRDQVDKGNERMGGETVSTMAIVVEEEEVIESPLLGFLWTRNLVAYDLLKLENQIPFFVVQALFDTLATPVDKDLHALRLPELALQLFRDIHPNSRSFTSMQASKVHHLLHLFHSSLVPSQPVYAESPPEWIPSATELKRSGIKFKTNEAAKSFLDVSFKDGIMVIPPLRVYDYTNLLFRNLIPFEQCYSDTRTHITIYAAFMDCIIDDAEDVKLLDLKRILVNRLSTDETVADLFNKLCDQIHYNSDRNYLADVFVRVTEYHKSKWHRWRAALIRDYFSSPWAGVAVVAAILLFLLTIEQSIFAAISYFRPP